MTTIQTPPAPATTKTRSGTRGRFRRKGVAVGAGLALAVGPLLFLGDYWLFVAAQVIAFAIAAMGLQILYGRTGQMSLAQGAFMGAGAYTGYIVSQQGLGVAVQMGAVLVVAVVLALVVGLPSIRLSPLRLAIVTLAFGELFAWCITNTTEWTGGTQGAAVDPVRVAGLDTRYPYDAYLLALPFAVALTLIALNLKSTHIGRRMMAVRDTEMAASSVGVPIARTKITAFLISAVYAGVAGWLYSATTGFIAPPDFDLFASVFLLAAVVIGGSRSILGAWMGAAFIVLMPEAFNLIGQPNLYPLAGGALLALIALLLPDGLFGVGQKLRNLLGAVLRKREPRP